MGLTEVMYGKVEGHEVKLKELAARVQKATEALEAAKGNLTEANRLTSRISKLQQEVRDVKEARKNASDQYKSFLRTVSFALK